MKFVRAIWHLLVGIKDVLVLIFMLFFFFTGWLIWHTLLRLRRHSDAYLRSLLREKENLESKQTSPR